VDGSKVVIAAIVVGLSGLFTFSVYAITDRYAIPTIGELVARWLTPLLPPSGQTSWGPGDSLLIEIFTDFVFWICIFSGLCWLIWKFRWQN
jgi:hypothetical protein